MVNWLKQLFSKFYKFYNFDVFIRETESWKQIKHLAQQEKDNQLKQQIVLTLEELYSKSSEIALMFLEYVLWHNSNVDIDEVRTILSNVDVDEINSNDVNCVESLVDLFGRTSFIPTTEAKILLSFSIISIFQ